MISVFSEKGGGDFFTLLSLFVLELRPSLTPEGLPVEQSAFYCHFIVTLLLWSRGLHPPAEFTGGQSGQEEETLR
jgi:hypothetical protein